MRQLLTYCLDAIIYVIGEMRVVIASHYNILICNTEVLRRSKFKIYLRAELQVCDAYV